MYLASIDSPVGSLVLKGDNRALKGLCFSPGAPIVDIPAGAHILKETKSQLDAYFAGKLRHFDLPLAPEGTPFRIKVWEELCKIPYGEIISYGDLARNIGNPKACRAVGGANHNNPISIIIPCHRVIGADGSMTGYGGDLSIKKYLLNLEAFNR